MKKKISELIKGDRFFHGMWYDFVSANYMIGFIKVTCTNGYDDRAFTIICAHGELVPVSKKSINS